MSKLLRKPQVRELGPGLTLIHEVTRGNSPLAYVEFKVVEMRPGATYVEEINHKECCIVALTGTINVTDGEHTFNNIGTRQSVFEKKPTDSVLVSPHHTVQIESVTVVRVALCYAAAEAAQPTKLIAASQNTIENRGTGHNQRLVHNILPDSDPSASSLLVVEVYTEAGNWSSYPPHKHDRDQLPEESLLEETYYHELNPIQGFVFQRVYTDDLSLDETMTVTNGDVVLVPKGYHPVGVPEGYTSYYLNVMAGPKRIWKFHNDPQHQWILERQTK